MDSSDLVTKKTFAPHLLLDGLKLQKFQFKLKVVSIILYALLMMGKSIVGEETMSLNVELVIFMKATDVIKLETKLSNRKRHKCWRNSKIHSSCKIKLRIRFQ